MVRTRATITVTGVIVFLCAAHAGAGAMWYTTEGNGGSEWAHLYGVATAGGEILRTNSNEMERTPNTTIPGDQGLYVASPDGKLQKLIHDHDNEQWNVTKTGWLDYESGGKLRFSKEGDKLCIALVGGCLGTVNFDTISPAFREVTISGNTRCDEMFALARVDGKLYGTTNAPDRYQGGELVKIDPDTARALTRDLLNTPTWGTAASNTPLVPEPTTAMLLWVNTIRHLRKPH